MVLNEIEFLSQIPWENQRMPSSSVCFVLFSPQANDSVHITWEAPSSPSGRILEYSMYMAVKKSRSTSQESPGQLAFIRIYRGTRTSCSVSQAHLDNAHIDCSASNRPAVVFRIAAKNELGYGPATQIRWVQGSYCFPHYIFFVCFYEPNTQLVVIPVRSQQIARICIQSRRWC